jgi:hypothetical protein
MIKKKLNRRTSLRGGTPKQSKKLKVIKKKVNNKNVIARRNAEAIQCSLSFWIASLTLTMTATFDFRLFRLLQPDGFAMTKKKVETLRATSRNDEQIKLNNE